MEGRFFVKDNKDKGIPKNCVMERRMLTTENEMDCCLKSPNQSGEHSDSSNVFVCVPLPVRFVIAIILLSFPLFWRLSLDTTRSNSS